MSELSWKDVDWTSVRSRVFKYQKRIYKASLNNENGKVCFLQKKLINSLDAKLLAVRRVTSDNKGKRTAGVDKLVIHNNKQREALVKGLRLDGSAMPIRRKMVPKPGRNEKRPLGIPVIRDRALQALVCFALEPQWEARFEANSYGFRPGRNCHDASEAIFLNMRINPRSKTTSKFVLDADISKCFDRIDHEYLLSKLDTLPEIRTQVNAWLKAQIFEGYITPGATVDLPPSERGTPQGGVISPLLMNIALHGLENHLKNWVQNQSFPMYKGHSRADKRSSLGVIRYADDFVVIHKDQHIIETAKQEIKNWLANTSKLELSEEKSKIICTNNGFEFLGWRFMHLIRNQKPYTHIYPSRKSLKQIATKIGQIIRQNRAASAYTLVLRLRPVIIGWCNYHKYSECSKTFEKLNFILYGALRHYVFRRNRRKGREYLKQKFFPENLTVVYNGTTHTGNWIFAGKPKNVNSQDDPWYFLPAPTWINSSKHVKVRSDKSVYDGDSIYWGLRKSKYSGLNSRKQNLLLSQKGLCPICNTSFIYDDDLEVDHITPISLGGKDKYSNLQLLHRHCHELKTRSDGSRKSAEEPVFI